MTILKGKSAIVTGGAQGIGHGVAKHLLERGMQVAVADIDETAGGECVADYRDLGDIRFFKTDVTQEDEVAACVQETVAAFGGLHALVNNAGIAGPFNGPVEDLALADWRRLIDTNLTGYFLFAKHAVPHLRRAGGAIVNIASTRALQSEPHTEAYAAAKGGIVALTHALAVSLGDKIRVNCISPGWIAVEEWQKKEKRTGPDLRPEDHAQHPAGRVGRPEDIAKMVAYLISDDAGFVTGQNFVVDGGMTRKMIYVE